NQAAVGRKLLDVPGYTFRVWVTNRRDGALELWRDYNGRAGVEQRIDELKHDLGADGFCLHSFFATESAFLAVLFTFNLPEPLSAPDHAQRALSAAGAPASGVISVRAVLGMMGRQIVVKLSEAWGGLNKHKPLVEATLNWKNCASPKLIPPEDRCAIGGAMI